MSGIEFGKVDTLGHCAFNVRTHQRRQSGQRVNAATEQVREGELPAALQVEGEGGDLVVRVRSAEIPEDPEYNGPDSWRMFECLVGQVRLSISYQAVVQMAEPREEFADKLFERCTRGPVVQQALGVLGGQLHSDLTGIDNATSTDATGLIPGCAQVLTERARIDARERIGDSPRIRSHPNQRETGSQQAERSGHGTDAPPRRHGLVSHATPPVLSKPD
ncbi:hypothetical protein [Mycolicibacterium fortuitum]|uniref:hypothetical protein n=1 Tax=Mycolicibacterium fortuitum TaxID=1766 RepID=UPI0011325354|nr:hypothetical protein [Mycolicibacterium fortuitum]TPW94968.1 hypothetical protein FKW78_13030 [Mycolicibacterium fortuitum]